MKKLFFLPFFLTMSLALAAQTLNQDYLNYIEKYKQAAVNQELTHKIPASITLAQGLLESGAGKSALAVQANNHFGIKCHSTWTGETFTQDDDAANECFRKYASAEESYEDHALFLMKARYQQLFQLDITDYKGWARGLKECGYATDANYAPKLIKLIEDYDLVSVTETAKYSKESKTTAAAVAAAEKAGATAVDSAASNKTSSANKSKSSNKSKSQSKSSKSSKKSTKSATATSSEQTAAAASSTASTADEIVSGSFRGERKINPSQVAAVDLYVGHTVRRQGLRRYVIAEPGDTYKGIAAEFNIELRRILRYNRASEYAKPTKGQKVWLNCKAPK